MAEKYLEISKIGGCRGNIGHVKERDLSTTLEVTYRLSSRAQSRDLKKTNPRRIGRGLVII